MGIQITARHHSVTDGMKRYAEEKGEKLTRFFDGLSKIELILDGQGPVQRAEAVITVAGSETIVVHAEEQKMNAAIDSMIDKAEKRIRRHKDKIRKRRGVEPEPTKAPTGESENLESYQEVIENTDFPES